MQTFLPYPSFERCARVLDPRRLGNQRNEALIVLRACRLPMYGWQHHPAVKMWRGHEEALAAYGLAVCHESTRRGFADSVAPQILELISSGTPGSQFELKAAGELPPWLGSRALHRSHRSALLRKNPEWYRPHFGQDLDDDVPYVWPT